MPPEYVYRLTFSFSIWISFISFFGLNALFRAFYAICNKSRETGQFWYFSDIGEKDFSFTHSVIIHGAHYVEMHSFWTSFAAFFLMKGCLILSNDYSVSINMIISCLWFILFMSCFTALNLHMLSCPCMAAMNATFSWCIQYF